MKIVVTAREILDRWLWDEFCEMRGYNPWAINEGLMPEDEEFYLTEEEAKRLGILKNDADSQDSY